MSDDPLDSVLSFNEHVSALAEAGIAFDLGDKHGNNAKVLEDAMRSLSVRTSLKQPIADALADERELPGIYRHAVRAGVTSDNLATTLDLLSQTSLAGQQIRRTFGYSLAQPLLLFVLAFLGVIAFCLGFIPSVTGIYEEFRVDSSWGLQLSQFVKQWMVVWVPLVPIALLILLWCWWRKSSHNGKSLGQRHLDAMSQANFAEQLCVLLESGAPLGDSLRMAAGGVGSTGISTAAEALAEAAGTDEHLPPEDKRLSALRPLLRWALTGELGKYSLTEILPHVSASYRQQAEQQTGYLKSVWPTLASAFFGGAIVLLFGLCLFGIYATLLYDLSIP